jgi:hypothetical protein
MPSVFMYVVDNDWNFFLMINDSTLHFMYVCVNPIYEGDSVVFIFCIWFY